MPSDSVWKNRLLTDAPFPVAYALRQAVEADQGGPNRRALALIDTLETLIRWATTIALAAYQQDGVFDRKTNAQLSELIGRKLTTGAWLSMLRGILTAYPKSKRRLPIAALGEAWFDHSGRQGRAARILDVLVPLRNRIVHGGYREAAELEALVQELRDGLEEVLRSWTPLLCTHIPVAVVVREGSVVSAVPMRGASVDFYRRVGLLDGTTELKDGRHTVLVGPEGRCLLELEPFCTRLGNGRFALLSGLDDDARMPGGHKLSVRLFAPSEERWLRSEELEQLPLLTELAGRAHDALESLVRRVSEKDLSRTIPVRRFPSVLHEVVARRGVFLGREQEVMRIREWTEDLARAEAGSRLMLVQGGPGMGKTSLLTNYALDFDAVWHIAAPMDHRDGIAPILTSLSAQIGRQFGLEGAGDEEHGDPLDLAARLAAALEIVSAKVTDEDFSPLVIIVDNLEGFHDRGAELLAYLPAPLPPGIGLILSCRSIPRTPRFPAPTILELGPLDASSVAQMSLSLGYQFEEAEVTAMAASLHQVTGGRPLFLRMILGDPSLMQHREGIRGPDDVIRLLLERYDGRIDEDDYEALLALLSVSSRPLTPAEAAEILELKPRKVRSYYRTIAPYLRFDGEAAAFSAPQLTEYLTGRLGGESVDPSIMSASIRRFIDYLRRTDHGAFTRYRRDLLPVLFTRLPAPEPREELRQWMSSPDFRTKISETLEGSAPHYDVALYLEHGGLPELAVEVLRTLLSAPDDELVIGTLLTIRALPSLGLDHFSAELEQLGGRNTAWISRSLCRLYRAQLRHQPRRPGQPTLLAMNLLPHLPFICEYAEETVRTRLVLSESYSERLEFVREQQPELIATTLDEVAALASAGFRYLPVYRLLHSEGLDGVVVGAQVDATCLGDLRGRTVGYEAGSISQLWLTQLLHDAGHGHGLVEHRPFVSIEDASRALHDGRIDAAVLWSPWLEAAGGRTLIRSGDPAQVINDVLCVRADLEPSAAASIAGVVATFDAYARGKSEQDAPLVQRYLGLTLDESARQLEGVELLDWARSRSLFEDDAERVGGIQHIADRLGALEGVDPGFFELDRCRTWIGIISAALAEINP